MYIRITPRVGFEPTTNRLTADRSTAELPRIAFTINNHIDKKNIWQVFSQNFFTLSLATNLKLYTPVIV